MPLSSRLAVAVYVAAVAERSAAVACGDYVRGRCGKIVLVVVGGCGHGGGGGGAHSLSLLEQIGKRGVSRGRGARHGTAAERGSAVSSSLAILQSYTESGGARGLLPTTHTCKSKWVYCYSFPPSPPHRTAASMWAAAAASFVDVVVVVGS